MVPGKEMPRPEEALGYIVYSCHPQVMRQEAQPSQDAFAVTVERHHLVSESILEHASGGLDTNPGKAQQVPFGGLTVHLPQRRKRNAFEICLKSHSDTLEYPRPLFGARRMPNHLLYGGDRRRVEPRLWGEALSEGAMSRAIHAIGGLRRQHDEEQLAQRLHFVAEPIEFVLSAEQGNNSVGLGEYASGTRRLGHLPPSPQLMTGEAPISRPMHSTA